MRRGTAQAFACAESFFKTLKRELETPDGKRSAAEVRQSVNRVFLMGGSPVSPVTFYRKKPIF
jgi:hypothetical protein